MSWQTVIIADVSEVVTGSTPKTNRDDFYGGEIPFVTPAELEQSAPIVNTPRTLSLAGAHQVRIVPENSVLVCCIGSLGKVGFAGRKLATNQQINAVVFDESKVWPRFGYYACRLLKPVLENMAPATTVAIVNKTKFQSLAIPLPPLDEQKRIAAILDQADELRRKRKQAIDRLNQLGQAIFYEMFGDPTQNIKNFDAAPLTQVFDFRTGKLDSNAAVVGGEYPFFTCAKDIFKIDRFAFDCEALLLAGNNASATYDVKYYKGKFNAYQRTYVIQVNEKFEVSYLYAKVALENLLKDLKRFSKGSNTKYITMEILSRMRILVPPISLQRNFEKLYREALEQDNALRNALAIHISLFETLQDRAFKGEL